MEYEQIFQLKVEIEFMHFRYLNCELTNINPFFGQDRKG